MASIVRRFLAQDFANHRLTQEVIPETTFNGGPTHVSDH